MRLQEQLGRVVMKQFVAAAALSLTALAAVPAMAGMEEASDAYSAGQYEAAFDEFSSLAAEGNAEAAYYVAHMYELGQGVPENQSQALAAYRHAGELGSAEGYFQAGQMCEKGHGTPRDYDRAFASYQAASKLGHAGATRRVAMMYAEGLGTQTDYAEAARLLQGLVEQGDTEAGELLAHLVATGRMPKDALTAPSEAPPAEAEETGAELSVPAEPQTDAERIRTMVEQTLGYVDMGDQPDAEADLVWTMDVDEAADGTITVDLSDLALIGKDASWNIGDWHAVMTPAGPSLYTTSIDTPTQTVFLDGQGREIGGTTIGQQRFDGVYNMDIAQFVNLDAAFEQIAIKAEPPGEAPLDMTIASASAVTNLVEAAPGKWSGPQSGSMQALHANVPGEGDMVIDRMWFDAQSDAIDYQFFRYLQDETKKIEAAVPADGKPVDEKMLAQMIQEVFAGLRAQLAERQPVAQGYAFNGGAEGARLTDSDGVVQFAADHVSYGMGFDRLDQPASRMTISYNHDGLTAAPDEGMPQAYLPRTFDLGLEFDNMPLQDAMTMALEMAEGAAADPAAFEDQMEMSLMFMAMGLQQQMMTSGAVLRINTFNFLSDALDVVMTGEVTASQTSPNGVVGHIDLAITGLDDAVASLKGAEKGSDEEELAMTLAMAQSMGTRTEVDGRSHHAYAFDFTPDGQMLLNGNDMEPLIDGMMQ
jgi:TPR repeat protein